MNREDEDLASVKAEIQSLAASRPAIGGAPSSDLTSRIMDAVQDEAIREMRESMSPVLASASPVVPSEGLTRRVMGAVFEEASRERRFRRRRRAFAALTGGIAAALAVVLLVGEGIVSRPSVENLVASDSSETSRALTMADEAADWLVDQQEADGSWAPARTGGNESFRPALTALALMALQRHAPERHAGAIDKAVSALESMQLRDGSFSSAPSSKLYNHAFASYALLQLQIERQGALTPVLKRAIAFSLRSQTYDGAWDYTPGAPGNTALSVWELGLLIQARNAGWQDRDGHLRRGLAWLKRRGHAEGFDYRETLDRETSPRSGGLTLTAMATATLLDATESFPQLKGTAEDAVTALQQACWRSEDRLSSDHYRDFFLARVSSRRNDIQEQGRIMADIVARHSNENDRAAAPWVAQDVWATTGGDLYATVMAMLSMPRG